jgi:cytochrome c biogenesis protein CcmG, thiol:disulfide interchange protein DsbE
MNPTPLPADVHRRALLRTLLAAAPLALALPGQAQALEPGDAAPDFTLPGLSGPVALGALRGQVVYLDFWASWCPPCRLSFPWMDRMQALHGAAGLVVVAVNVDRQRAAAERFLQAVPTRCRVAFDPEGRLPARYGAAAMPSSFIIGRDSRLRLQHGGFREADEAPLEAALRQALAA